MDFFFNNTLLLTAVGVFLTLLVLVQLFLAIRHDHVVAAQDQIATLEGLDSQIDAKRDTLADMDKDLEERRKRLADIAGISAEVDALATKRDELEAEWAMLDAKREEVRTIRAETEEAWTKQQQTEGDLQTARTELEAVRSRLEAADELTAKIATLETREADLRYMVEALQEEARKLQDAEARFEALQDLERDLQRGVAQLEGRESSHRQNLNELETRIQEERATFASLSGEVTDLRAQRAAMREMRDGNRASGPSGDVDDKTSIEDRLKELNTRPAVLEQLVDWAVWQPSGDRQPEAEALDRVAKRFAAVGLNYHPRILRAFHTSMKVNETSQMTVLSGISGTGKSQLPRQYAAGMGIGFLQVPVQPRWDSPQDLMGFFNYIEGRFRPTDLARALWQLDPLNNPDAIDDRMMLLLLDEMNLARVEYYFSDFLSRLESRPAPDRVRDENLRKDAEIELEIPMPRGTPAKSVFPGYNLLFTGTMNEDESTQSLSDKVVDRANVMRFAAPKRFDRPDGTGTLAEPRALTIKQWNTWQRQITDVQSDHHVTGPLEKMRDLMTGFRKPFGHRLDRAMLAYVANYPEGDGIDSTREALADQVEMRLLPKLRGVEVDNFEGKFSELQTLVESDLNDEILAKAIESSVDAAREGSGQFAWTGVTRA